MQHFIIFAVDLMLQIFTSKIDIYAPIFILYISRPQKLKSCDKKKRKKKIRDEERHYSGLKKNIRTVKLLLLNYNTQILAIETKGGIRMTINIHTWLCYPGVTSRKLVKEHNRNSICYMNYCLFNVFQVKASAVINYLYYGFSSIANIIYQGSN